MMERFGDAMMVDIIDGVLVTGNCNRKSACQMYIKFVEEKYGQKLKWIDIQINKKEDVADLRFEFKPWHYERGWTLSSSGPNKFLVGTINLYL